jgi:transcriptional regulator with XRE-family HTH domain
VTTANPLPAPVERGRHRAQNIDHHVGAMLRARRLLGMTQQGLAEGVGITYQQAHKYETGANRITIGRLYALAEALGVEPAYFFQGLGAGEHPPLAPRQRRMLELTRSFAALSRRQQEALCGLARALAEADALAGSGPGEEEGPARDAA